MPRVDCTKWRGYLVLLGGVLVHLTLGTVYSFGNMNPYITSYLRQHGNPSVRYGDSVWIFASTNIGQGVSTWLGGLIHQCLGPRWTTLLGSLLTSAGVLLTYFSIQQSFTGVVFTYGLMFGIGVGISYPIPIAAAMKWMPRRKGLVVGCVLSGFGGGSLIFDQIQRAYINPNDEAANHRVRGSVYFTQPDILDRVPNMFLILGACYVVLQVIGSLLVINPPPSQLESTANREEERPVADSNSHEEDEFVREDADKPDVMKRGPDEHSLRPPREVLRQKEFYMMWLIFLFNGQSVVFMSSLYKAYGQTFIKDDEFLAIVGSVASVFNAGGRIAWGYFADRTSFKVAMMCLCTLLTFLMLTLGVTSLAGKGLFLIYICLIFGTLFGMYALFPVGISRAFGQRYYPINYGLLFTAQVIQGFVGATLTLTLEQRIGWYGMFFTVSGFSFSSLILMFFFRLKNSKGKDI